MSLYTYSKIILLCNLQHEIMMNINFKTGATSVTGKNPETSQL